MKPLFHKKRILFLSLVTVSSVVALKVFLGSGEENRDDSESYQKKKIKTSCREIVIESKPQKNTTGPSQRIELLTQLTNTPIDWTFKDIHGQYLDLYCLRERKNIVIHFWATWCPPCIEELPSLAQFAEANKDQIFVVAISTEPLAKITNFLNQAFSDLSPHLKIAQVSQENKSKYFPEDSLPVTYIFNKQGLLKNKELGPRNWTNTH